jgi:hypothetical protein
MRERLTDEEILAQIPAARARAKRESESGIRALDASYDAERRLVVIHLKNGSFFGFPPDRAQGLRGASEEQHLAEVEVTPSGGALHWETLDADLDVSALLAGVFGTKEWMRELGRAGGSVRSEAKSAAARRNGRKGGRPRS